MIKKSRQKQENYVPITGKELKIAAIKGLKVRYQEKYYSPYDSHMNYNKICRMTPANEGYYIGQSDIDPSCFDDDDIVSCMDFGEGFISIYKVPGVEYK